MRTLAAVGWIVLVSAGGAAGQNYDPPKAKTPDKETLGAIAQKTARLGNAVAVMQRQGIRDPVLADVEIYHKAGEWMARHGEYFTEQTGAQTLAMLDRGILRATFALRGEAPWHMSAGQANVRAYRSRVDGSVQPYAVTFPAEYGRDPSVKWRLDVVLHGRDSSISEVKFLYQHSGDKPAESQPFVQLDIFGRGNNAYRWAGEMDVLEAMENFFATEQMFGRGGLLDRNRAVLRGFSMGGAGTWHLGLHRPDRWCVIGPGAGFTVTKGYWKELPKDLPSFIDDCLHIYDAADYAANAAMVPVVAYAGENDPQLQAARNIEARLKPLNIPMTLFVGTGLEHKMPSEWQTRAEGEYEKYAAAGKGRNLTPGRVRFTTFTLRYPGCDWIEILGLDRHYRQAEVDATRTDNGFTVKTANVRQLRLVVNGGDFAPLQVLIDGQDVNAKPFQISNNPPTVFLEKRDGKWASALPQKLSTGRMRKLQKVSGLQGPIDDAFMDRFVCVRGTGTAWNEAARKYADADLARFQHEWDKFMRGDLPVKSDMDVTEEDIATRHLILFGDPGSNSLLAQVVSELPIHWTKDGIALGGKSYDAASHVPALIYPSPLNAARYVVINSGHTFHAADFADTNARLFPRLGDYAILKPAQMEKVSAAAEVVTAGIFDDFWQIPMK
ncbi:MAG: hypothetical protein ACJ8F7_07485 [Gemmataceae bacterium]